ncbi:helix-turn-helix transcriptional regulator [Sphingobacterium thalpophilum]|uniref:helix-turn-helix transcriptional regulator n=1 Tax=Sphingobacterium thalpophilum TaxID=259 RepID=UPI003DA664EB
MSVRETLIRHNLVINKLRARSMSWEELDDFLAQESELQEYKLQVSQRQFQRDINDIFFLYGIEIKNNKSSKKYAIVTSYEMENRSLEAFDVFNLLKMGGNKTKEVSFEKRRPLGTEHLAGIVHAIRNTLHISFTYHKFYEINSKVRRIEPYLLKEVKNRWYVIGNDVEMNKTRVFALDRIGELHILDKKFTRLNSISVERIFDSCFGIILPEENQQVEEIILSFSAFQGKYIKSLPIHQSQEILIDNEKELRIRLYLYVTYDFVMELLSLGREVTVLNPPSLQELVIKRHNEVLGNYSDVKR